jgi:hypothetical protein
MLDSGGLPMAIHLLQLMPVPVLPMMLTLKTLMIKIAVMKIRSVFPFKTTMVVLIIYLVTIVAMPPWVAVISVPGISLLKIYLNMNLRRSRTCRDKTPGDDHD